MLRLTASELIYLLQKLMMRRSGFVFMRVNTYSIMFYVID